MKKLIVSIITIAFFTNAFCQVKIGVKASLGPSWFGIKETSIKSGSGGYVGGRGKFSFSAGIFSKIVLYKNFSVQPEILFSRISSSRIYKTVSGLQYGLSESESIHINQIQIPVNLRIESKRVYFMAGPSYSIMFSNPNYPYGSIPGSTMAREVKYNKPDIGLNITLGIKASDHISIDAKYYPGFSKMDNLGYKQQFIHIGASYTF